MKVLADRGLLILENPGHASQKKFVNGKVTLTGGKAAVYRLGDPLLAPLARWDTDECPRSTYVPRGWVGGGGPAEGGEVDPGIRNQPHPKTIHTPPRSITERNRP